MSLKLSLLLSIGSVILLTLIGGGVALYANAVAKVETELTASLEVARRTAVSAIATLETPAEAVRRLPGLVVGFNGDRHIRARFLTPDDTLVAISFPQRSPQSAPDWFVQLLEPALTGTRVDLPPKLGPLGHLQLSGDARSEATEVWTDLTDLMAILLALSVGVMVLIYWQLGRSLKPLEDLSRAFARVERGDTETRVQERGPRELLQVYSGFNAMVGRLQLTEDKNRRLKDQLLAVQEEERADLARDLHDEIGPFLFAVDVDAAAIAKQADSGSDGELKSRIGEIRQSVRHMQAMVRSLLGRLRPAVLLDLGLEPAVDNLAAFWRARHRDIAISIDLVDEPLGQTIEATVYRVIQESMSNAIRHGKPKTVHVSVQHAAALEGTIEVRIENDGAKLPEETSGRGFGLRGMAERVTALGGEVLVRNRVALNRSGENRATGVEVVAWLPLSPPDAASARLALGGESVDALATATEIATVKAAAGKLP